MAVRRNLFVIPAILLMVVGLLYFSPGAKAVASCDVATAYARETIEYVDRALALTNLNTAERNHLTREKNIANKVITSCAATTTTTRPPTTTSTTTTTAPTTTTTTAPTTTTTAPTTTTTMPSGMNEIPVNLTSLPTPNPGDASPYIVPATNGVSTGNSAAFRTNCQFSNSSWADPIVAPGGRVMHLHDFFGNTGITPSSTATSVANSGNSTCQGGTANRTAYWVPAMLDTSVSPARWVRHASDHNTVDGDNAMQVYYKSGYDGVQPEASDYPFTVSPTGWVARDIQAFPAGLRFIAGDAMALNPQSTSVVEWFCIGNNAGFDDRTTPISNVMQTCQPGENVAMTVEFPQCWDGVNLDSPNHKSHMAYGAGWPDKGCPPSHPVPLPQITQLVRWEVPASGMAGWRLSSDMTAGEPRGQTAHADWMNGWDPAVMNAITTNCMQTISADVQRDCQMNLLGDGRMLGGPAGAPPPPMPNVALAALGDSNVNLAQDELRLNDPAIRIIAQGGAGVDIPADYWSTSLAGFDADRVIVNLGINDTYAVPSDYAARIDRFMARLAGSQVYWTNLPCEIQPTSFRVNCRTVNSMIAAARSRWLNLTVVDWAAVANSHPEYMVANDVHYNSVGQRAWADYAVAAAS